MKSDTLLLADIFGNFKNACLKTYELDPAYFLSLPGFVWQACLKMTGVELELLTEPNGSLMVKDGITGGITQVSHGYAKANNKYMKNYDKNEESLFLMYLDGNNLYGCQVTEKLPAGSFKWVKNKSKIDKELIKTDDKNDDIGYFLKADIDYPEELYDLLIDLPFSPEKMKINGHNKVLCTHNDKKNMLLT